MQGDMDRYKTWLSVAKQADAIVVASSASLQATVTLLQALIAALQETQKPLVYISGSSLYGDIGAQERVDEDAFVQRLSTPAMNQSPENVVYRAKEHGVHGIVIVGAGILYGRGGGSTPSFLLEEAKKRQVAWYIGEGQQRWSSVHVEDLAHLTVLAVEQMPSYRVFNAVAQALSLHETAEIIAQVTHIRDGAQSISEGEALSVWGSFWARILSRNLWLSSTRAENILGWKPVAPSFKDDLLSNS
ncbi:hypothetical protein KDA_68000 [Dictyobacter alpinus]|uniref:NAD-dependent epimerase/dehydratase domain-containing protein n=1 Tax=Dictyobacter alpinus TaxID=2014873 RepID=A0A402BJ02_9CHLR|nr:hypothetical protein KDA_68000 [Dictyobacter alpinus]